MQLVMVKRYSTPWKPELRYRQKEWIQLIHVFYTQIAKPQSRRGRLCKCSSHLFLSSVSFVRKITSCSHAPKSTYWWKGERSVKRKGTVLHLSWVLFAFVRRGSGEVSELAFKVSRCDWNPDVDKWNGGLLWSSSIPIPSLPPLSPRPPSMETQDEWERSGKIAGHNRSDRKILQARKVMKWERRSWQVGGVW